MIPGIFPFDNSVAPAPGAPSPERVLEGDPQWLTWGHFTSSDGSMHSGFWQSTPGKWRVDYRKWEYFNILSGEGIVESDNGEKAVLSPGVVFVIEPGFKGTWTVISKMKKLFFVRQLG